MTHYLDTSFLLPLFSRDAFSSRAQFYVASLKTTPCVSDFGVAEFVSVVAKRCRTGLLNHAEARTILANFDQWRGRDVRAVFVESADMAQITAWLRRLDLNLRAPDALHLAVASRLALQVVTFDRGMAEAARKLSIPLAIN